jgi:hypothetical protein
LYAIQNAPQQKAKKQVCMSSCAGAECWKSGGR